VENILARINSSAEHPADASNQIQSQQENLFPDSQMFNQLINSVTNISGRKQQEHVAANVDTIQNVESVNGVKPSEAIERLDNSMPMVTIYAANDEDMIFEPDSVLNLEPVENSNAAQNQEPCRNTVSAQTLKISQNSETSKKSESPRKSKSSQSGDSAAIIPSSSNIPEGFRQQDQASTGSGNLLIQKFQIPN
jgi:hypothetical protein